jgi:chromatin assembly factor 1 subunit B
MSSSDGFCSSLTFSPGELGEKYTGPLAKESRHSQTPSIDTVASRTSNNTTPTQTPTTSNMPASTTTTAPAMTRQPSAGFPASPSSFIPARPGSSTRSNSVSSITTASSFAPGAGDMGVMNLPTPSMAAVPGLAAANSGPVGVPMFTPPLTPAHGHSTHSASSSVSGIPGGAGGLRRESESERDEHVSPHKKRDLQAVPEVEEGRETKKRRIAPTPVSFPSVEPNDG